MNEEKFWLIFWAMVFSTIVSISGIYTYAGYLNDQRDTVYVNKGLQPYKVEYCARVETKVEWHEADWKQSSIALIK